MVLGKRSFSSIFFILVIIILIIGVIKLKYYQKEKNKQKPSSFSNTLNLIKIIISDEKGSCEKLGGRWQSVDSPDNRYICNLPTIDGGKMCTDSSQCESFCQANEGVEKGKQTTGQCYTWKISITPCIRTVQNGISKVPICY